MKKEIKIALTAIVALVVLFFGLNFLKGVSMFSDNNQYYVTFKNISGVDRNCPIYAEGVVVGSVSDISYDYSHAKPTQLLALINKQMVIPDGTTAEIKSDLMGNTQVNLILGDYSNASIPPGGTIAGNDSEETMAKLKAMIPTMESMVPKLDSILTSLSIILSDPAILNILDNTDQLTANLTKTSQQLNTLTAQLNKGVPGLMEGASRVLDNSETLTANLSAVDVEGTMSKVNQTLDEVNATMAKINSPEGTIGKMISDPDLYDNLNSTMADADSLMIDLKNHPKRYVHFSLFGKNDK